MNREHVLHLLNGYVDGELDLVHSLEIEEHLQGCVTCSRQYDELLALRAAAREASLFYAAPAGLDGRIHASLKKLDTASRPRPSSAWRWLAPAAGLLAVLLLAVVVYGLSRARSSQEALLAQDVETAHVRSLMADHLTDVTSSDQHTVKPWFDGKLDFSPPVVDLSAQGFPLIGGRLDYLDGHSAAALVYRRNKHYINLFIWPTKENEQGLQASSDNGYNLIHWNQAGMSYWAISDVEAGQLQTFVQLIQASIK